MSGHKQASESLPWRADHIGWFTRAIYFHTVFHPVETSSFFPLEIHLLYHPVLSLYLVFVAVLFRNHIIHLGCIFSSFTLSPKLLVHPTKQIIPALVSSQSTLLHCSQQKKKQQPMPGCVKTTRTEEGPLPLRKYSPIFRELSDPTSLVSFYDTPFSS